MTENFWEDLTATVERIITAGVDGNDDRGWVNWAITSALNTLEQLHDEGRLTTDHKIEAWAWFSTLEALGLVHAGPFPLLAARDEPREGAA